jgi:hypothetical protein
MGGQLHLVGLTADGCRIARDGGGGYVVNHADQQDHWQRVANLPAAYAACEVFTQRDALALPRRRKQA